MGLFDDALYPDNKERYHRAEELANDLATLAFDVSSTYSRIQAKAKEVNERFTDLLASIGQPLPEFKEVEFNFEGSKIGFHIAETLAGFLTFSLAYHALGKAAVSMLLRNGQIGAAAFSKIAGFPRWISFGRVVGGFAAVVVGELIISSIQGANTRANLRGAINDAVPDRADFKQKAIINGEVLLTLNSLATSFEALKELGHYDIEILRGLYENLADKNKKRIEEISLADAAKELASLDRSRGSWTNEDPQVVQTGKSFKVPAPLTEEAFTNPVLYNTVSALTAVGYKENDVRAILAKG